MIVATPEKLLLKLLWDAKVRNGRPPLLSTRDLAEQLSSIQQAGISVYPSWTVEDLEEALVGDVAALESLGFVRRTMRGETDLTGAGELLASTLEYPEWVRQRLAARGDAANAF